MVAINYIRTCQVQLNQVLKHSSYLLDWRLVCREELHVPIG